MVLGLLLADFIYLLLLLSGSLAGAALGHWTWRQVAAHVPLPATLVLVAAASLLGYVAFVCLVALTLPRPKAGKHRMFASRSFYWWMLHMLVRRALDVPPVSTLLMQFNTLRWLSLRCLGARVHFTTNMSSDVMVLDPWLFEAGPNVIIGARTAITGHYIRDGVLRLSKITIGSDVVIGGDCGLGLGTRIGDKSRIYYGVRLMPYSRVDKGCTFPG